MTRAEQPATLDALRAEIDRIDRDLHARLIARGEIIDELISVKARQHGVSAFRPAREADMMRELVTRHRGILPLATVESIWRIIISTFTYVQAPYTVHADVSGREARMRDSARFHFGFTVPLATHADAAAVIASVAAAPGDLGLVRADGDDGGEWWLALTAPDAPKIIARLPFVERADHAAGLPVFIVAKPLSEGSSRDVLLFAVAGRAPAAPAAAEILVSGASSFIVAVAGESDADSVAGLFRVPGREPPHAAFIGSHAARFEIGS